MTFIQLLFYYWPLYMYMLQEEGAPIEVQGPPGSEL